MNLFVKKNIMLVSVFAVSGVVGLVLLVFVAIASFGLFEKFAENNMLGKQIDELGRKKPAPHPDNVNNIKKDLAVIERALVGFKSSFAAPMQPAVDEFIKVLAAPRVALKANDVGLNEEEYEKFRYKYPKEDDMDEEQLRKLPKRARKLTLDEFKDLYRSRFERDYGESPSKNMLATQELFIDRFRRLFPNWNKALEAFVKIARTITVEPIANVNDESVLLAAMGFPRAIPLPGAFVRQMEDYGEVLKKIAGEDETVFMLAPAVLEFMSKTGNNYNPGDVREIYFHRDVLGDMLSKVAKSGVKAMYDIKVRDFADAPEEGRIFGNLFETVGDFKISHYTIEVSGSLANIRNLCKTLDESYKDRRFYIVRAVTLYAEENGAAVLMGQKTELQDEKNKQNPDEETQGRGRRRRRRQEEEETQNVSERDRENWLKVQADLEAKKKPHERREYGVVLVGNNQNCRAMIDIDYVIPEQQQQ